MIKIILFDADGMIIKRDAYFSERFCNDFSVDPEKISFFFRREWYDIVTGKADLKDILKKYLTEWHWSGSVEDLLDYWFVSERHVDESIRDHIVQLKSSGIICCLATNQEKYRFNYITNTMEFGLLFDRLYASCNLGVKKPDPTYFDYIWKDLGKPDKKSILFWDDTKANVYSSREFGIQAEIYTTFDAYLDKMQQYGL